MNYITRHVNGTIVVSSQTTVHTRGFQQTVNHLALHNGSTLEGRMTSARFLLGITHVPPLYISTEICFVTSHALRHPQCVLINVHQVLKWTAINNGISIQFLDGTTLQVALSVSLFQKRIAQAEELQALLNCFYRKESVYTTV